MQLRPGIRDVQASRKLVTPILGDDVHLDSSSHCLGRRAGRLDHDFLESLRVEAEDTQRLLVLVQAFHVRAEVRSALAVNPELTTLALVAAHVLEGWIRVCGARDNRSVLAEPLGGRDRIQRLTRDRGLLSYVLDIYDRGLLEDGHRLRERTRAHLGIDRRCERRRQFHPFPLEGAETGQRERDTVASGPQIHNSVKTTFITDDGTDPVDQSWAGCFHRDAGYDCSRRISYDSGYRTRPRALRPAGSRQQHHKPQHDQAHDRHVHGFSPLKER